MRRVKKPATSLKGARRLLLRRKLQRYLPGRPGRALGLIGLTGLVVVGGMAGIDQLDRGSRLRIAMLTASAAAGLSVQNVAVEGRRTTQADDVLRAVDVVRGEPILDFSPERARQRLESLPWVRSATVERRLPDTVTVRLVERTPLALWQHDGKMALVDTDGVAVTDEHLDRYADLLLVVGEAAPRHTAELLAVLGAEPDLRKRVTSAVWVGDRRWNLVFDGTITVELPETGVAEAWSRLAQIERSHGLFSRDLTKVDLRLADRVAVTPTQSSAKPPAAPAKPAKPGVKPT